MDCTHEEGGRRSGGQGGDLKRTSRGCATQEVMWQMDVVDAGTKVMEGKAVGGLYGLRPQAHEMRLTT